MLYWQTESGSRNAWVADTGSRVNHLRVLPGRARAVIMTDSCSVLQVHLNNKNASRPTRRWLRPAGQLKIPDRLSVFRGDSVISAFTVMTELALFLLQLSSTMPHLCFLNVSMMLRCRLVSSLFQVTLTIE